jgi:hypothetical protein
MPSEEDPQARIIEVVVASPTTKIDPNDNLLSEKRVLGRTTANNNLGGQNVQDTVRPQHRVYWDHVYH